MSAHPKQARRLLYQHLARRHPYQTWVTRLLMRRMTLQSLAMVHDAEHRAYLDMLDHADDDFTDVADA